MRIERKRDHYCSGVTFSHEGGVREYGIALADMPFPLL